MRLKINSFFLLLFIFSFFKSQEYFDRDNYAIFLDAKTNDIKIIENDSIVYTNGFNKPQKLIKTDYPEKLCVYQYDFIIHNKNYFVNNGGGTVLEYDNNHLRRIDQSFLHKNQFGAAYISYKNEIYLFGGYGLFTSKNILTKYDFKGNEWFLVPLNSKERPHEGHDYESIVIGDDLYVFGGGHQNEIGIGSSYNDPNYLWKFNFKNRIWENIGTVNLKYIPTAHKYGINTFTANDKIYVIDVVYSAVIDIKKNKVYYYKSPYAIVDNKIIYNPKNKTINYLKNLTSTRKTIFVSTKVEDFFKEPFEEDNFYHQPLLITDKLSYLVLGIGLATLFPLYYYRTRKKKGSFIIGSGKEQEIVYQESKDQFIHNNNSVNDFSPLEKSILTFLIKNIDVYIPIHSINFIIEKEVKTNSINTLLRKRESLLHLLKSKLSIMLNISYDEIILEQKNQEDRRIKEVKLNDKYFKIIK